MLSVFKPGQGLASTLTGRRASQDAAELRAFVDLIKLRKARSYLEIGARHGDTFYEVMSAMPFGSRGVAVDLPGGAWGVSESADCLAAACRNLRDRGYDAHYMFGDSTDHEIIDRVSAMGPYDAALIDGDHRYAGVKADWLAYGPLAEIVAFHDIAGEGVVQKSTGHLVEVPKLWNEIKNSGKQFYEFITRRENMMGIGVIER